MSTQHLSDEQLSAHLDGVLATDELTAASDHLAACADCAARVELLRATTQAVATLPAEEMPRALDLGFLHEPTAPAIPETSGGGLVARIIHGRPPGWLPTAVAAAAVLVLAIDIGPRLLPPGGNASQTSAGAGEKAAAPRTDQNYAAPSTQGTNPSVSGATPGSTSTLGDAATSQAARKTVAGPDGSTVSLAANPPAASAGSPTQLVLTVRGASSGTSLAPAGMQLFVSQGPSQVRVAGSVGAGQQVRPGQELALTAEWSAGAVLGPPAPGSYTLVGRVFLADGRPVEVTLPFSVSPG